MTCEHVSDKVCLDVGSAVVAEQSGYHQRGDAAERQKQREAEATEQSEVQRHFDLQWMRQLHSLQDERVQPCKHNHSHCCVSLLCWKKQTG